MLKREQSSEPDTNPIPERRIRPEELTRALAAIEARRAEETRQQEEETRRRAETVPIGEAIEDLSLPVTPEELWAEVDAQREQDRMTVPAQESYETIQQQQCQAGEYTPTCEEMETPGMHMARRNAGPLQAIACLIGLGLLLALVGLANLTGPTHTRSPAANAVRASFVSEDYPTQPVSVVDAEFYRKLRLCQGPKPEYKLVAVTPYPSMQNWVHARPGETLYPARAIPDGYSVYHYPAMGEQSYDDCPVVLREIGDDPQAGTGAWRPFESGSPPRVLTRYNRMPYLRGWVSRVGKSALEHGHAATVYFTADGGQDGPLPSRIPVTIPLWEHPFTAFTFENLLRSIPINNGQIQVPEGYQLSLDSHAWEPYPTLSLPEYRPPAWTRTPGAFGGVISYPRPAGYVPEHYSEFDGSSVVTTVGQLADGQTFRCGTIKLSEIAAACQGRDDPFIPQDKVRQRVSEILVDTRPSLESPYTLTKIGGSLYLRGWVEARMPEAKMQGHYINIYSDPNEPALGYHPVPFSVRLDRCGIAGEQPGSVSLSEVHLDGHAWEKWQS